MAEDQIVEDVEASCQSNETEKFTIFRVPYHILENNKNLFEPLVVSIGPFHRGNTRVRAMEEQKWRFLQHFLSRGGHISLDLCKSEMKLLEERTRRCYSETVDLDSNGFVEMMLLDGCFLLEYFKGPRGYISEVGWNNNFILNDLLLLENQIPFFVVEKLCEIGVKQEDRINFVDDLIYLISQGPTYHPLISNPPAEIYHLVHLYHQCSVPDPGKPVVLSSKSFPLTSRIKHLLLGTLLWMFTRRFPCSPSQSSSLAFSNSAGNLSYFVIPCASELQDVGIKFRPKSNPRHMLDISFVDGVLEIPKQLIAGDTKAPLANLVACEQSTYGQMGEHFSSFALFFHLLVNMQKDAMILQQCGIIQSSLDSEEELTDFFHQASKYVVLGSDHFLAELFVEVNRYCKSSWNKHRAKLIHDYFGSPWTAISLIAALVLLVLTFVQSFFAAYSYFVPSSS